MALSQYHRGYRENGKEGKRNRKTQAAEEGSNGMSNRRERKAGSTVADTSDGLWGCEKKGREGG